jgi:hypothetical protein
MDGRTRAESEQEGADEPLVRAHESRPGRTVFTEADNPDAWIATDVTYDAEHLR